MDCVSCGLWLPVGSEECPGCGASQLRETASGDDARCAHHPDLKATRACERCGAFLCTTCDVDAGALCVACVAVRQQEVHDATVALHRRFAGASLVHVALMCLPAFLAGETSAAAILSVLGAVEIAATFAALARPRWLDLAMAMGGASSLICLWLVFSVPLLLPALLVTVWAMVQIGRWGNLERDGWRAEELLRRRIS